MPDFFFLYFFCFFLPCVFFVFFVSFLLLFSSFLCSFVSCVFVLFFLQPTNAPRQYTRVPAQLKDHDLLPNFSEIPSILTNIRHPRRRAISVGPQSEADAYETLAYREKRRRESLSGNRAPVANDVDRASPAGMSRIPSKLNEYENMMGTGSPRVPSGGGVGTSPPPLTEPFPPLEPEEPNEEEVFAQIKRPRVRYDVEVVTKLVVYSGKFSSLFPSLLDLFDC